MKSVASTSVAFFAIVALCAAAPAQAGFDLREALATAHDGQTIRVPAGVYDGPIQVNKAVNLIAEPGAIIDGHGRGTIVQIIAPGASFRGFLVRGTGDDLEREHAAIWVKAPRVTVEDNQIEDALFGICVHEAAGVTLRGNRVSGKQLDIARRGDGIRLWYSADCRLEGNTVHDVRDVVIWFSKGVHISRNYVCHSRYGLHFMFCDDNVLEDNRLEENSVGTYLMNSRNLTLRGNTFAGNRGVSGYGLGLKDMDGIEASGNRIVGNRVGIYIDSSPTALDVVNHFQGNLLAYNEIGVAMLPSVRNNAFWQNTFQENQEQVSVLGSGLPAGNVFTVKGVGNYWSDYRGFDANGDGIGDLPYQAQSLFENLMDRQPRLRLFLYTPAQQVLEMAAQAAPTVKPRPKLVDTAPLMRAGDFPAVTIVPGFSAASGVAAFALLGLASLVAATGLRSRDFRGTGLQSLQATSNRNGSLAWSFSRAVPSHARGTNGRRDEFSSRTGVPAMQTLTSSPVLAVSGLSKYFGKFAAVDDLSFSLERGQALALWGGNGAGKTTAIRCILGVIRSRGQVVVEGQNTARDGKAARARIGYVPQESSFQGDLSVAESLRFYAKLKGASPKRAAQLLEEVELAAHQHKKVSALSGGMRKRLALAAALLNDPPLLVLDEIAANLDAAARRAFLELLCGLKAQGKAILFTSHRLDEVQTLADQVLVLKEGRRVGLHAPSNLAAGIGLQCRVKLLLPEAQIAPAVSALQGDGFAASRNGRGVWVGVAAGNKAAPIHTLARQQIVVSDFEVETQDVEHSHD